MVTGSHRSGSTWTGKVLATAPNTGYVQEPFNLIKFGKLPRPLRHWFEVLNAESTPERRAAFRGYAEQFTHFSTAFLLHELRYTQPLKYPRALREHWQRLRYRRMVVKDPIAVFAAPFLAAELGWQPLVLVRHPAAFAESLKAKNWGFNFRNFTEQEAWHTDFFDPFRTQIQAFAEAEGTTEKPDIIAQAALVWNVVHHHIHRYKQTYPNWLFVRHEDLSREPEATFKRIFSHFLLPFAPKTHAYIRKSTHAKTASNLKRDSQQNIKKWKKRLSAAEIARLREQTETVAAHFYSGTDW